MTAAEKPTALIEIYERVEFVPEPDDEELL